MSPFTFNTSGPCLEWLGEDAWRVHEGFSYTAPDGQTVLVEAGLLTDLASIPKVVQGLLSPAGPYMPAALVHDQLYARHRAGDDSLSRAQADDILLAGMEELGVSWLTRWTIYLAVKAGGWMAWSRPRRG